jgi:hypothetical protein
LVAAAVVVGPDFEVDACTEVGVAAELVAAVLGPAGPAAKPSAPAAAAGAPLGFEAASLRGAVPTPPPASMRASTSSGKRLPHPTVTNETTMSATSGADRRCAAVADLPDTARGMTFSSHGSPSGRLGPTDPPAGCEVCGCYRMSLLSAALLDHLYL